MKHRKKERGRLEMRLRGKEKYPDEGDDRLGKFRVVPMEQLGTNVTKANIPA